MNSFTLKHKTIYSIILMLFIIHQALELSNIHFSIVDQYLDALLFPLIVLPVVLLEKRILLAENSFTFSPVIIISYFLLLAIISEWVFTSLSDRFVFDWLDVVMIGVGTILFHFIFNQDLNHEINS